MCFRLSSPAGGIYTPNGRTEESQLWVSSEGRSRKRIILFSYTSGTFSLNYKVVGGFFHPGTAKGAVPRSK
jgi:hypothetical protein